MSDQLAHDISVGYAAADEEFKRAAYDVVVELARTRPSFTAYDVWIALPRQYDTHERRALAGVLIRAKANGVITSSGETVYRDSPRHPRTNPHPRTVWLSLIYMRIAA